MPGATAPTEAEIREGFDWPDGSQLRASFRDADTLVVSRWQGGRNGEVTSAGVSLPFGAAGPLVGEGLLRLASDPLAFTAGSSVFSEPTALLLDASLRSTWQGIAVGPWRGLGLFSREHGEGGDWGAFLSVPLGSGAGVEGLLLESRFPRQNPGEDWFLGRSAFPGGDITHAAGRLYLRSSRFDCSVSTIVCSPAGAAPGSAASLWVRGKSRNADGALLVSMASPEYRRTDARCLADTSVLSAAVRLGGDPRIGTLRAGIARSTGRPEFAPHPTCPSRTRLTLDASREFPDAPGAPAALLLQADREIGYNAGAERSCSSRCGAEIRVMPGGLLLLGGGGISDRDGGDVTGAVVLAPGSRLQARVEMKADGLGVSPHGSGSVTLALVEGVASVAVHLGLEDYPLLTRDLPRPPRFLRISLLTSIRSGAPSPVSPSLPPG